MPMGVYPRKKRLNNKYFIDMVGKRFGRLTVLEVSGKKKGCDSYAWLCVCDCGNKKVVDGARLRCGRTLSCGCLRNENRFKIHGLWNSSTYGIWRSMIQRCENSNNTKYNIYGGRGIKIFEPWHKFVNFLSDMGIRPVGLTLDRIDTNGNYEPDNCRWTDIGTQNINKRTNHMITYNGITKTMKEWSILYKISWDILDSRLRDGWDIGDALNTKVQYKNNNIVAIVLNYINNKMPESVSAKDIKKMLCDKYFYKHSSVNYILRKLISYNKIIKVSDGFYKSAIQQINYNGAKNFDNENDEA